MYYFEIGDHAPFIDFSGSPPCATFAY